MRFHRIASSRSCVCSEDVNAPRRCAPSHRTAATYDIKSSARTARCGRAWMRLVPPAGLARVGRRCHLDSPHGQRGMGCATFAHVHGRRRRRHLRHRRPRRHRRHLLPRRLDALADALADTLANAVADAFADALATARADHRRAGRRAVGYELPSALERPEYRGVPLLRPRVPPAYRL
jgi:hypothetical protein